MPQIYIEEVAVVGISHTTTIDALSDKPKIDFVQIVMQL